MPTIFELELRHSASEADVVKYLLLGVVALVVVVARLAARWSRAVGDLSCLPRARKVLVIGMCRMCGLGAVEFMPAV